MQAKPTKSQCNFFYTTEEHRLKLTGCIQLDALGCVKLLCVDIDKTVKVSRQGAHIWLYHNFSTHILRLGKNAGKELQVLRKLSNILDIKY